MNRLSLQLSAPRIGGSSLASLGIDVRSTGLGHRLVFQRPASGQRQIAAAIEKALADGKVAPELRGQVRAMMAAEGAKRVARGERFKVPVYDARTPRARAKTIQVGPQRHGDRERSR